MRLEAGNAARCAQYVSNSGLPVLAQGLADAALGELVLARDALGVDAQQDLDAVSARHRSAAVTPTVCARARNGRPPFSLESIKVIATKAVINPQGRRFPSRRGDCLSHLEPAKGA
jgi:hypothetical protein